MRTIALFALALASCAPEPAVTPVDLGCRSAVSSSHPATLAFWDVFEANDLSRRAGVLADLQAAHEALPAETELTLLLGLSQLWALADPAAGATGADMGRLAVGALTNLRAARSACPTDARITAWLGPILVRMGRLTDNQEFVDEGFAVLDDGVAEDPEFVSFSLAMVLADQPIDGPEFARALSVLRDNVSVCTASPGHYACSNGVRVPHNLEGSAIFMGDIFARAGDTAMARATYEAARSLPDFATWDHASLLDERLATLDERVRLSQDADPMNDPPLITSTTHACSVCHAN